MLIKKKNEHVAKLHKGRFCFLKIRAPPTSTDDPSPQVFGGQRRNHSGERGNLPLENETHLPNYPGKWNMFVSGRFFFIWAFKFIGPKNIYKRPVNKKYQQSCGLFGSLILNHSHVSYVIQMILHLIYLAPMSPAWKDLTHKIQGHPKGFWEQKLYI